MEKLITICLLTLCFNLFAAESTKTFYPEIAQKLANEQFAEVLEETSYLLEKAQKNRKLVTLKDAELLEHFLTVRWILKQELSSDLLVLANQYYELLHKFHSKNKVKLSDAIKLLGHINQELQNYSKALDYYYETLSIREATFGKYSKEVLTAHNQLAVVFQEINQVDKARYHYEKSLSIAIEKLGANHKSSIAISINLAVLLHDSGFLHDAIAHFHSAVARAHQVLGEEHLYTLIALQNLGDTYFSLGDLTNAFIYTAKANAGYIKTMGKENGHYAKVQVNLGNIARDQYNFDLADKHYQQARIAYTEIYGNFDNSEAARLLRDQAVSLKMQNKINEALTLFLKVLPTYERAYQDGLGHELLNTQLDIAEVYYKLGQLSLAEKYLKKNLKALQTLKQEDNPVAVVSLIYLTEIAAIKSQSLFKKNLEKLIYLLEKRLYFNSLESNESFLFERLQYAKNISSLIDKVYPNYIKSNDLELLEYAFRLSKLTKTSSLAWAARAKALWQKEPSYRSIQLKLKDFREKTKRHNQLVTNNNRSNSQEAEFKKLNEYLANLGIVVEDELTNFTSNFTWQFAPSSNDVTTLYYHFSENSYVWKINGTKVAWYRLNTNKTELFNSVQQVLQPMYDEFSSLRELKPYDTKLALKISNILLSDIELSGTQLNIVADENTIKLPFSALPLPNTKVPNIKHFAEYNKYSKVNWLQDKLNISYVMTFKNQKLSTIGELQYNSLIAIADPSLSNASEQSNDAELIKRGDFIANITAIKNLPSLPETRTEVEKIASYLTADQKSFLLDENATEKNIYMELKNKQHDAIVIASHAFIPNEINGLNEAAIVVTPADSKDASNDGLLLASELADLSLNAKTVILSGCSTGVDSNNNRLGLESLIHSFIYAGTENIIATYWPVESTSQAIVMNNYIKNKNLHTNLKYKHPVFWAGLFRVSAN